MSDDEVFNLSDQTRPRYDDDVEPSPDLSGWHSREGQVFDNQNPRFPGWQKYTSWNWLPRALRSEMTKMVYVGWDLSWWDLAGPQAGRQGVVATNEITGIGELPFEHKYSEGPYVAGATLERTDIKKRIVTFGAQITPNAVAVDPLHYSSSFKYRDVEKKWQTAWSRTKPGWLGFWTRSTGYRWLKVYWEQDSKSAMSLDPVALDNNSLLWNMSVVAPDPYFYKPPITSKTFVADAAEIALKGKSIGLLRVSNRGTSPASPIYMVQAPGNATVPDGPGVDVELPELFPADKYMMVDTDENARTITGATDPVDNPFYRFIRQAGLIDFFLHDLEEQGLPVWRRWDDPHLFEWQIAPRTAAVLQVSHDYPGATITAIVPQRFETAWG